MINMTNVQYGGLKLQPLQHLFIAIFNDFLIVLISAFCGNMPQTNIFANSRSYDWSMMDGLQIVLTLFFKACFTSNL